MVKQKEKSKGIAILLAVLFGILTWCYTWRKDYLKFYVAIALFIFAFAFMSTPIIPLGLFVWAIIDQVYKPDKFFKDYYKEGK